MNKVCTGKSLGLALGLSFLVSGCTHNPILTMHAEEESGEWKNGVFWTTSYQPDSELSAGALGYSAEGYQFKVAVTNTSQARLPIKPDAITCLALDEDKKLLKPVTVVDTEERIQWIKRQLQHEQESTLFDATLDLIGLVGDLVVPEEPKEWQRKRDAENLEEIRSLERQRKLQQQLDHFQTRYIRRHDLAVNESLSGLITCRYFPAGTGHLALRIPVGSDVHEISWRVERSGYDQADSGAKRRKASHTKLKR